MMNRHHDAETEEDGSGAQEARTPDDTNYGIVYVALEAASARKMFLINCIMFQE